MQVLRNTFQLQVPAGPVQIDWQHPLANGLIVAIVPGAMGAVDIAGLISVPTTVGGSVSLNGSTPEGAGLVVNENSGSSSIAWVVGQKYAQLSTALNNATLYTRGYIQAFNANTAVYWGLLYSSPDASPFWVFGIGTNSSGVPQGFSNNGVSGQTSTSTFGSAAVGAYSLGLTGLAGSSGTGGMIGFSNGVSATSLSSGGFGVVNGLVSTSTTPLNGPSGPVSTNDIRTMVCGYIWNRVLSNAEMLWIHQYPYDFLIPIEAEMMTIKVSPPPGFAFRRNLSPVGTRIGSRQVQGWDP